AGNGHIQRNVCHRGFALTWRFAPVLSRYAGEGESESPAASWSCYRIIDSISSEGEIHEMRDLLARAIETACLRGAAYADARAVETLEQSIQVKDGKVESLGSYESIGFGVRVLVGG